VPDMIDGAWSASGWKQVDRCSPLMCQSIGSPSHGCSDVAATSRHSRLGVRVQPKAASARSSPGVVRANSTPSCARRHTRCRPAMPLNCSRTAPVNRYRLLYDYLSIPRLFGPAWFGPHWFGLDYSIPLFIDTPTIRSRAHIMCVSQESRFQQSTCARQTRLVVTADRHARLLS
jgi:hypothetical protein